MTEEEIIDDDTTPIEDDTTPIEDDTTPIEDDTTPIEDDITPIEETKPISRAQQEIIKLRERAQKAEEDARKAREEIEKARAMTPSVEEQKIWEEEEAALKNPNLAPWQRYAIEGTRAGRLAQKRVADLERQSLEREDKANFSQLRLEKPKIYEAYKDRVEEKLKEIRATGQNVSRIMLCDLMLGEDMRTGKFKTKSTSPVKRGETPKARSDAPRSDGRLSAAEALAKKLEGVPI
jgi:hypothetical protein